jgi:glycosyltransferase involved in cell wall biosynthesis
VRVHVVALPHTLLTRAYDWCAYTAKVRRFVGMLQAAGHTPLVYGPDVHELPDSVDYTVTVSGVDRVEWFGAGEWNTDRVFLDWNPESPPWAISNARAAAAIRRNWEPGDVLGNIAGQAHAPIAEALDDLNPLVWEWGIGYPGILDYSHHVFESHAWAHYLAGRKREGNVLNGDDIAFFDTVIPNCFDPEDFDPRFKPGEYLLFMARPTARKGLAIVQEIANRGGLPVKIAGQPGHAIHGPNVEYVGLVTGQAKAELLAGARALLSPTVYLEPFGGVAVEAMLSGTPVIATDWGAFTETVIDGVTGYRCRTLRQFLTAVDKVGQINRHDVLAHAQERYTTDVGARLYSDALDTLGTLYGDGWYTT